MKETYLRVEKYGYLPITEPFFTCSKTCNPRSVDWNLATLILNKTIVEGPGEE